MPHFILMSSDFAPLIIVGFFILVIGLGIYGYLQAKKRREDLAKLAKRMGLRFDPSKDYGMEDRFGQFSCLREGSRRYAHNSMRGVVNDRPMWAFDYHYETYSRDSKGRRTTNHHYFSAVVIYSGLPLKHLFIRPEGFFDKVTEFVGFDDIDFESAEFSNRFYVKADDKRWAFDVIHQATMEFLLKMPEFHLEFGGPHVIVYRNSRFDVAEFPSAVEVIEGVLDRLPQYLLRELKGVEP